MPYYRTVAGENADVPGGSCKSVTMHICNQINGNSLENLEDHLYQEKRSDEWRQVESTATGCMARLLASFKIATHNNEAINAHTFCINYMQQL